MRTYVAAGGPRPSVDRTTESTRDRRPSSPRTATDLLALQRLAGNLAVQRLLETVQRCGDHVQPGCACAEDAEAQTPTVSRSNGGPDGGAAPPAAPACLLPGARRVPGSDVDSVDQAVTAGCLPEAYAILNGHARFGLLPLLSSLRNRASFAQIRSSAARMGGPRMVTAIDAVDLRSAGGPITGSALRGLVDQMETLPPDQRRDILQFLGALVVIDVQGLAIDFSYCKGASGRGCRAEIKDAIAWAKKSQAEYAACRGKKGVKTAVDVEACKDASLAKQGITTTVAGSTSSTGVITITPTAMSKCQPILDKGTEIHEAVHDRNRLELARKHGAGTPAFDAAWD